MPSRIKLVNTGITAVIVKTKEVGFMASRTAVRNTAALGMKPTKNRLVRGIGHGPSATEPMSARGLRTGPTDIGMSFGHGNGQNGLNYGRRPLLNMGAYAPVAVKPSRLFSALTILAVGAADIVRRPSMAIIPVLGSSGMDGPLASKCFATTAIRPSTFMENVRIWFIEAEEEVFRLLQWDFVPPEKR
jgi:hypothetical protein